MDVDLPDLDGRQACAELRRGGVTAPIIGPRTLAQLDDAQRAVTVRLEDDVLKRLDDLFPGYKTAPEHYAW